MHAKTMIADRISMVGSAIINERSMLGTRDSEIAAIVFDDVDANSQSSRTGSAKQLRIRLWAEHAGVKDPALLASFEDGLQLLGEVARDNTTILASVFPWLPARQPPFKDDQEVPRGTTRPKRSSRA